MVRATVFSGRIMVDNKYKNVVYITVTIVQMIPDTLDSVEVD